MGKKRVVKSLLTLALTLTMLLGVLPISALAADEYGYGYRPYRDSDRYYYDNWYYYGDYYDGYYNRYNYSDDYYYYRDYNDYYDRYVNSYNYYYRDYGRYYDDNLYRRSRSYLVNNEVTVEGKDQIYTGSGTLSFVVPDKGIAALTDVVVYPDGNRDKEIILERGTDFTVKKDRLTITLTESFLKSLNNDNYKIIIYFVTDQGYSNFTVKY